MSETRREPLEDPAWESLQTSSRRYVRHLYRQQRAERWFKIITAIMLCMVVVALAWSGYQAARWGGVQSSKYAQAKQTFKQGQAANQQSDDYMLNAFFLAVVLLLTSLAGRFTWKTVRAIILAFALGMLLYGIFYLFTSPIT